MWFDSRLPIWLRLAFGLSAAAVLIALAIWLGPEIARRIVAMETWVAAQGVWAPVVFALILIVLTLLFVPDSLFGATAGAMFGIGIGFLVTLIGLIAAQCIAFGISRHFLVDRVQRVLARYPRLAAIERAADGQSLRLLVLIRLSPLNPALVSYVFGATRARFTTFLVACAGLIPGTFMEVYCGYMAKHMFKVAGHVSEHSRLHTALLIAGLVACVILTIYIARLARKAISESTDA